MEKFWTLEEYKRGVELGNIKYVLVPVNGVLPIQCPNCNSKLMYVMRLDANNQVLPNAKGKRYVACSVYCGFSESIIIPKKYQKSSKEITKETKRKA